MSRKKSFSIWFLAIAFGLALSATAQAAIPDRQMVANNTPSFVSIAKNLGRANPAETMDVMVWLKPHSREELDSLAEELYDPSSSRYHAWLKPADIVSRFAPTAEEAAMVGRFLAAHNLAVVSVGPNNFSVRGRGTLRDVENTFHVEINRFELNGETYRANTSDPYVESPAAALVGSISGLDDLQYEHPSVTAIGALKQQSLDGLQPAATADAGPPFFTTNCFTSPTTESFSGIEIISGIAIPAAPPTPAIRTMELTIRRVAATRHPKYGPPTI